MTIDQIQLWELILSAAVLAATILLGLAGLLLRWRGVEDARETARQEHAEQQMTELRQAIQAGDDKARKLAHDQIEDLRQDVRREVSELRGRMDQVEREVAAMPTRDQMDRLFGELRATMKEHHAALTARMDSWADARRGDGGAGR